jgi:hypothetical protein
VLAFCNFPSSAVLMSMPRGKHCALRLAFDCHLLFLQSLGWRTMLVVPELEQELAVAEATRTTQFELKMLRNARSDLDTQVCAVAGVRSPCRFT